MKRWWYLQKLRVWGEGTQSSMPVHILGIPNNNWLNLLKKKNNIQCMNKTEHANAYVMYYTVKKQKQFLILII